MAFPQNQYSISTRNQAQVRHGGATPAVLISGAVMYDRTRPKVLIVDHTRLLRQLVRDALLDRFPGLEIIEAGSVTEGYHYARDLRPGLALLEVRLPDGSGLELARRIRDELPEVSVCICTTYDYPEYRQAAAAAGAAHFISKQDSFWSDTEYLVRTELQLTGSDRDVLEDRVKTGMNSRDVA
jgi:DNA-binding response OmpR family regulator